jgi:hypothetical protein
VQTIEIIARRILNEIIKKEGGPHRLMVGSFSMVVVPDSKEGKSDG